VTLTVVEPINLVETLTISVPAKKAAGKTSPTKTSVDRKPPVKKRRPATKRKPLA